MEFNRGFGLACAVDTYMPFKQTVAEFSNIFPPSNTLALGSLRFDTNLISAKRYSDQLVTEMKKKKF